MARANASQRGYVPGVQVWLTPPDRDQRVWRIEVGDGGRVEVRRLVGGSSAGRPLPKVRTVDALGAWLFERGIDPGELRPA